MGFNNSNKRDILILVSFPNVSKIKEIQKKYYDIADKVEPHIALCFPFDLDFSDEELYKKLCDIVSRYKPFKIVCHGVSTPALESNYRFLNIVVNKDIIKNLSDDIYREIIPSQIEYRDKYHYDPHISLANLPIDGEIELDDSFEMIVDSLYVERIGENDESIKLYDVKIR